MTNHLFYGDNLTVLREHIKDETVDLVYLDPPFNSQANYNILFKSPAGIQSQAQIEAFEDTWHWNQHAEQAFDEVMSSGNSDVAEMLRAMRSFLKENDMMAYLTMMAVRLLELHRVLKPTGSLYLHCDPTASHYLKTLMDAVFGATNFRSELIWKRTGAHSAADRWGDIHDTILYYTKSDDRTWNEILLPHSGEYSARYKNVGKGGELWADDNLTAPGVRHGDSGAVWRGYDPTAKGVHWKANLKTVERLVGTDKAKELPTTQKLDLLDENGFIHWPKSRSGDGEGFPRFKRYLSEGVAVQDVIMDIPPLNSQAQERLGYPTQKPLALLERILKVSSNEDDVVLDPFCGCGTTIHAAQKLRRKWIGIDITHLAISLIEKRLKDAFPGIEFKVHGTPKDLDGARALAEQDKYQFQWWAVSLVNAVPYGGKKKGADSGIDGFIYFKPDGKTTEKAIVSVKGGGNVGVPMIRDMGHVVDREKAKIGVFITLAEPTKPMQTEAVKAGYYETPYGKYQKLQILTIEELFAGKKPNIPLVDSSAFKKAGKEDMSKQDSLF
ncbi:MAG TPA: DNA methyltransferase [Bryobacteraceae bacterium]|jgi:site-specific DNA-methyltransferase (adenine-specific)|nr:DNA methyltransferase [Bryobacteraceae bacterium]